ncbi:MAG: hypothetical protein B6226_00575 [Candidatus Cloacimonetes bacterium 4572_65]|nr:MAG: hypothetical protein B6226_00575 [Candidatus Cloacimonetes bacterium 4572_65]
MEQKSNNAIKQPKIDKVIKANARLLLRLKLLSNSTIAFLSLVNVIVLFISPTILRGENFKFLLLVYSIVNVSVYSIATFANGLLLKLNKSKLHFHHVFPYIAILSGIGLLFHNPEYFLLFISTRQIIILLKKFLLYAFEGKFWKFITENPAISLMISFLLVILVGTILLMLPIATTSSKSMPFINAFFTSTSATCVTGLAVEDTGTYFSHFGQLIILTLIQIGGLGLMTISTAFALLFGQRLTVRLESVMQNIVGESNKIDLITLLRYIVGITVSVEIIGAVFLFQTFKTQFPSTIKAVYYSIFHSVSAFCNAGFALYPRSFETFVGNWNINIVLSLLIIFGGLGFVVYLDIQRNIFKKRGYKRFSLHTKIVLITTFTLTVVGIMGFFISEYNNTMRDMNFSERLLSSMFQSVTCRTAGFNTIDQSGLSYGSILLSVVLMFIGASPGSTGGGIKTTTFAIMVLAIVSIITGKSSVSAFKRKISMEHIKDAVSLIGITLCFALILLFALFIVSDGTFEEIVFEAFSALGTVGLTIGMTSKLNLAGKIIIIMLMYLGRIGPLTILYALAQRVKKKRINYLEEKISIG